VLRHPVSAKCDSRIGSHLAAVCVSVITETRWQQHGPTKDSQCMFTDLRAHTSTSRSVCNCGQCQQGREDCETWDFSPGPARPHGESTTTAIHHRPSGSVNNRIWHQSRASLLCNSELQERRALGKQIRPLLSYPIDIQLTVPQSRRETVFITAILPLESFCFKS